MIEWVDKYSVGVSIIDEEHKEFVGIVNKAIVAKQNDNNPEEIREVLNEMIKHSNKHFVTEEAYMIKFKYSDYLIHKSEHLNFTTLSIYYYNKLINGDCQIIDEVLKYLKWWLSSHK
jgi:hemerythrin|tara:strand:- start:393 stop:743 length:351 start_codon:yes stop_codon:yes gene_type:complete